MRRGRPGISATGRAVSDDADATGIYASPGLLASVRGP